MARIRSVKPEVFLHEDLFELEKESGFPIRIAFVGLWTCCDREGRFKWRPGQLKAQILPYDNLEFSRVLDALVTRGFVGRYACVTRGSREEYGCIPTWNRHQVVNNRESASQLPDPRGGNGQVVEIVGDDAWIKVLAHVIDACSDACTTRGRDGKEEGKGKEGKGREAPPTPSDQQQVKSERAENLQLRKFQNSQSDTASDLAGLLVQEWSMHGPKISGAYGVVRVAEEALLREVEQKHISLTEAFSALKAYQEAYFQSPLFKSGNGYYPISWFRNGHYLDDPATWESTQPFGKQAEVKVLDPCTVVRSGRRIEEIDDYIITGREQPCYDHGKLIIPPYRNLTEQELAARGTFVEELQKVMFGAAIWTDAEVKEARRERAKLKKEGKLK